MLGIQTGAYAFDVHIYLCTIVYKTTQAEEGRRNVRGYGDTLSPASFDRNLYFSLLVTP